MPLFGEEAFYPDVRRSEEREEVEYITIGRKRKCVGGFGIYLMLDQARLVFGDDLRANINRREHVAYLRLF